MNYKSDEAVKGVPITEAKGLVNAVIDAVNESKVFKNLREQILEASDISEEIVHVEAWDCDILLLVPIL